MVKTHSAHVRPLGIHLSIAGGVSRALDRAGALGIDTMQIFLQSPNKWDPPDIPEEEVRRFMQRKQELPIQNIFAHSIYLINLASDGDMRARSTASLAGELRTAELLGIAYLVVHPGSRKEKEESRAITDIASAIDVALDLSGTSAVTVLLETTAGQGSSVGHRFGHLRDIIAASRNPSRLKVCIDTCHIFAAGYDFTDEEGYRHTIEEFTAVLGLDALKLIHLNDSKKEAGSRIDRHEHIGSGLIGDKGFSLLLRDRSLRKVPLVLETPKFNDTEADIANLKKVRSLITKKGGPV
ncbi:MAG TPA: deoxyribonuclease IV [Spirochaetota bacterium]|nr:deoxyribonuclease IV [Spirochaetota bacterium]